jgi:ribosomal protein S18 acetylase RimI-like enzyme
MQELIRRSESIERAAWSNLYRRAPWRVRRRLGLRALDRGEATFLGASRVDHLFLNRAIGVGSDGVATAVEHFEQRGIGRFWIHMGSELRYSDLPGLLRERGITPYPRSWMKFVRPAAAIYTRGDDAYLPFAATVPKARQKGCQRALIAARLERAQQLDCRQAFTETGMPVAGEPSSSYRNMLRVGFDELHVRDNFAPEGCRWHNLPSSDAIAKSAASPKPSGTWRKGVVLSGS